LHVLFGGHRERSPVGGLTLWGRRTGSPLGTTFIEQYQTLCQLFDGSRTIVGTMGSLVQLTPARSLAPLALSAEELDLASVLHALSDPVRLLIIAKLADGNEHTCGSFNLPVTKSTSSHHFRVLREAGVVATRIDGKSRFNRLQHDELEGRFPGLIDSVLRAHAS
jgi:DNA-binding transcriptional ArsR family regulator